MADEIKKEIELEIAYVLFIDIVGYSKLVTSEQRRLLAAPLHKDRRGVGYLLVTLCIQILCFFDKAALMVTLANL